MRLQQRFYEVIGRSRLHRFKVDLVLTGAGQEYNRGLAATFESDGQQFDAILGAKTIIHQHDIVAIEAHLR